MICVKIDAFKVDWGCIPFKNKSNFNPLHLQWLRCREKGRLQDLFIIGGGGVIDGCRLMVLMGNTLKKISYIYKVSGCKHFILAIFSLNKYIQINLISLFKCS